MEDVFDAGWRNHPASRDTPVDAALASLIDIRGLGLLDDPAQLRELLSRTGPNARQHVDALIAALSADVPRQLVAVKDDDALGAALRDAVARVQAAAALDTTWATWAVRTWAHALALPTTGLDAPGGAMTVAPATSPIPAERPPRADGFDRVGAGTIGGLWDRAPVAAAGPPRARRDEPTWRPADDVASPHRVDGAVVAPPSDVDVDPDVDADAAAILVEPLFADRAAASDVPAENGAPAWTDHARPVPRRARSMIGPAVTAMVVLVVAAIAWFLLDGAPGSSPVAPSSTSPSAAAPPVAIAPVPADAVPAAVAPPPADPAVVPVEPAAPAAVVEAPEVKPLPVRRPVIVRIDVPTIIEGTPFTVGLQLGADARDVVAIERRIVDRGGAWPKQPVRLLATALRRTGERTLLIPFVAMDAPSRALVEFVAIGPDDVRGNAKRVTIALDQPDPAIAALDIPVACTSATCGVVVASREIEPEVGTRGAIYQLSVRMDDRQVVTTTAPYRLQVGSRVRLAGSRLVPDDRRAP